VESIINLVVLLIIPLIIPYEVNNSFIIGYSAIRFAFIFSLLVSALLIAITINLSLNTSAGVKISKFIQNWLQDELQLKILQLAVIVGIAVTSFFVIELVVTDNQLLRGMLLRLSPIIGFGTIALAQISYLITKLAQQQGRAIKFTNHIYQIALVWIILKLLWFLGSIRSLDDILIFKRIVILSASVYIFILFSLDYVFTSDTLSKWFLAFSLLFVSTLSLWITNRFNEMSEYSILALLLLPTFMIQLIFLAVILIRDKEKQNLTIANITINIKVITVCISAFASILVTLALILQISEGLGFGELFKDIRNTFTLDREMNVPATFSAIILLIAAGLLFVVFVARRKKRAPFTTHWGFLSLIFVFLSYDEMFSLHESIIGPLRRFVKIGGIFSYEWIILAIPLVLIMGISYLRFFFHLPPNMRILFFLAASLFLGGSIGGEMLSGWYASRFGEGDANYVMLTIFEETLEMSGIVIFIHALLLTCFDSLEKRIK
jgi:hypothetical protein